MLKERVLTSLVLITGLLMNSPSAILASSAKKKQATFKVTIENISNKDGISSADGSKYPFALSPGFYIVSDRKVALFKEGKKARPELEAQAEDGDPSLFSKRLLTEVGSANFGVFNTPLGGQMPSPLLPGNSFEFTFTATEGMKLDLVTMFGQSNDLFYGNSGAIDLFQNGQAISGDITNNFKLWDAGTEINQAPGIGPDQAPRQKMKNSGTAEHAVVHLVNDGFAYPTTTDVLRITITVQ